MHEAELARESAAYEPEFWQSRRQHGVVVHYVWNGLLRRLATASLVLAIIGSGCTADDGASDLPTNGVEFGLFSDEDERIVFTATQTIIQSCMRDRGFRYLPPPFLPDPVGQSRRLGPADIDVAEAQGYHLDLTAYNSIFSAHQAEVDALLADMSQEQVAAYNVALTGAGDANATPPVTVVSLPTGESVEVSIGDRQGSCAFRASQEVYGSYAELLALERVISDLRADVESRAMAEMQSAFREWASCMDRAGYAGLTDPLEAVARFYMGDIASDAERAAAVADVQCKVETRLVDRWEESLSRAFAADARSANLANEYNRIRQRALENARALAKPNSTIGP